jgi:flagellar biosynthetic protein FlhB
MAGKDDSQEKTEDPTQKKLDDSKKKGQVARSKELVIYSMLLVSSVILLFFTPAIYASLEEHTIKSFTFDSRKLEGPGVMMESILEWVYLFAEMLTPIMFITAITAIASSVVMGGWVMSIESVRPKLEKISPAKGLKRIFSSKGLMELIKSIIKITVIGSISYLVMAHYMPDIMFLSSMDLKLSAESSLNMLGYFFLFASSGLLLVVLVDVPFQIHSTKKELMMSKQDIKDEMKDTDGRPEVKMKRRELARKLAFARQMDDVPTADVVITNPTHYSIAIKYNGTDDAPIVVAMGTDMLALKIRTIAKQYNVNVVESPPLARSLYYFSNVGEPIHHGLYEAVAKLLSYVYQLQDFQKNGGNKPTLTDIEINKELRK